MGLRDLPKVHQELLAVHEAFRRLKFPAKDIFIMFQDSKVLCVLVREDKNFAVLVGEWPKDQEKEFMAFWDEAVRLWNSKGNTSTEDHERLWAQSRVRNNSVAFVSALILRLGAPAQEASEYQKWLN